MERGRFQRVGYVDKVPTFLIVDSPSGKELTFTGTTIVRMEDGKIVERWANVDELGLLQQLGLAPMPPGSEG